ncbi:N-acetyltransferase [Klebsiella aerogenes]|uniref:N-acetyltransferase n=1 Tax=Klebsiella aerogenes TaxID=548 RepID=A0AAP9R238_KLEAE|nr:N-acetyltransferase [Klebsiella aerogenes]QMR43020.1 N-acetyltransferase [Klebsiella aerogenes]
MRVVAAESIHSARLLGLLEENAMGGDIDLVLTRRPDFFSAQCGVSSEHPVIALEGEKAVGMCMLTRHMGFANGEQQPLGYLGSLRISPGYRHRVRILKKGFAALHQFSPPERCYTSIASDNVVARRLLEKGISGLPRYQCLGDMLTLAISRRRGKRHELWRVLSPQDYPQVVDFYSRHAQFRQLAPTLCADWLNHAGLPVLGYSDGQELRACAVLWDQRAFKQVLAAGYSRRMRVLRPFWNGYAAVAGRVALPQPGQPLEQSFLAWFACNDTVSVVDLVEDALTLCPTKVMTLGLPAGHPDAAKLISRTCPVVYRTCLYCVNLSASPSWDPRMVWPEVALL